MDGAREAQMGDKRDFLQHVNGAIGGGQTTRFVWQDGIGK